LSLAQFPTPKEHFDPSHRTPALLHRDFSPNFQKNSSFQHETRFTARQRISTGREQKALSPSQLAAYQLGSFVCIRDPQTAFDQSPSTRTYRISSTNDLQTASTNRRRPAQISFAILPISSKRIRDVIMLMFVDKITAVNSEGEIQLIKNLEFFIGEVNRQLRIATTARPELMTAAVATEHLNAVMSYHQEVSKAHEVLMLRDLTEDIIAKIDETMDCYFIDYCNAVTAFKFIIHPPQNPSPAEVIAPDATAMIHPQIKDSPATPASYSKSVVSQASPGCAVCCELHQLRACQKFRTFTVDERRKFVDDKRICWNCLSPGHLQRSCNSLNRCRICKNSHHSLLHPEEVSHRSPVTSAVPHSSCSQAPQKPRPPHETPIHPQKPPQPRSPPNPQKPPQPRSPLNSQVNPQSPPARPQSTPHVSALSRIVLDEHDLPPLFRPESPTRDAHPLRSHVVISNCSAGHHSQTPIYESLLSTTVKRSSQVRFETQVTFASRYREYFNTLDCLVYDEITDPLPPQLIDVNTIEVPRDLLPADPFFHEPTAVDLLLGIDIFHSIQIHNEIRPKKFPTFIETMLGWTAGGQFPAQSQVPPPVSCFSMHEQQPLRTADSHAPQDSRPHVDIVQPAVTAKDEFPARKENHELKIHSEKDFQPFCFNSFRPLRRFAMSNVSSARELRASHDCKATAHYRSRSARIQHRISAEAHSANEDFPAQKSTQNSTTHPVEDLKPTHRKHCRSHRTCEMRNLQSIRNRRGSRDSGSTAQHRQSVNRSMNRASASSAYRNLLQFPAENPHRVLMKLEYRRTSQNRNNSSQSSYDDPRNFRKFIAKLPRATRYPHSTRAFRVFDATADRFPVYSQQLNTPFAIDNPCAECQFRTECSFAGPGTIAMPEVYRNEDAHRVIKEMSKMNYRYSPLSMPTRSQLFAAAPSLSQPRMKTPLVIRSPFEESPYLPFDFKFAQFSS
jgi:hypothetical protein